MRPAHSSILSPGSRPEGEMTDGNRSNTLIQPIHRVGLITYLH
jgi:hypothetical protein